MSLKKRNKGAGLLKSVTLIIDVLAMMALLGRPGYYWENDKDERIIANIHRTSFHALWATLAMLLILGTVVAVFEVQSVSAITGGIVGILAMTSLIWVAVFSTYDQDIHKEETHGKRGKRGVVVAFVVSLIPIALLVVRWVTYGLNFMSQAFFYLFVLVSLVLLGGVLTKIRLGLKD